MTDTTDSGQNDPWAAARDAMVAQLRRYGISDPRILEVMSRIPRERFVPADVRGHINCYADHPCSIGHGQTISQPYIVAYMTELLRVHEGMRVLEVGTGSGYQAAILGALGAHVFSLELVPELAEHARKVLAEQGYDSVRVRTADGYLGWSDEAPFEGILAACAPVRVPEALCAQLAEGGRMVLPVGNVSQRLVVVERVGGEIQQRGDMAVRFVPMVHGDSEEERR